MTNLNFRWPLLLVASVFFVSSAVFAQVSVQDATATPAPLIVSPHTSSADATPSVVGQSTLDTVHVLGASRSDLVQPTAPNRVSKKKLDSLQTTNVGEALKSSPGIYIREEDGQGLRPNIGLRGTNPDRSKKIVILEDGVLAGPAPYSAPAAYFVPSMSHTSSLEVMSGFTAVHHGPNSIGGAINYVTPAIPAEGSNVGIELGYGSFNTRRLKGIAAGATSWGGYHLQLAQVATDGFKKLDGGGETGFIQNDFFGKLRFGQRWTFTLGASNEDSHETYLGISQADFDFTPYRRYKASTHDEMKWEHLGAKLEYEWVRESGDAVVFTGYHNRFHRDWYRLDRFRGAGVKSIREILSNPSGNQLFYDILRGADSSTVGSDGELVVFSNDRSYVSEGAQARWLGETATGDFTHSYQSMIRLHRDRIDRDHTYDFYEMSVGQMARTTSPTQQDRLNSEEAMSLLLSAQDDVRYGDWVFTGVGRFETVGFAFRDKMTGLQKDRSDSVFVPGIGVLRKFGDDFSARASVNRAVTVAGLDATGREKREEALNYELGFKYFGGESDLQADLTFFVNDYENLTGTCTASSGCATANLDTQLNGGSARFAGAELRAAEGFQVGSVWIPLEINLTLISAQFRTDFTSTAGDWGEGAVVSGDPLPYIPEAQYRFTVGAEWRSLSQELQVTYQSRTFDSSAAASRYEIPAYGTVDYSASYAFTPDSKLRLKADNILGRDYQVAGRPFGFRPGKPTSLLLGYHLTF